MKQKSMHQRLQSRISLRRNWITELENQYDFQKNFISNHSLAKDIRQRITQLAGDQKLDRELYQLVIRNENTQREFKRVFEVF